MVSSQEIIPFFISQVLVLPPKGFITEPSVREGSLFEEPHSPQTSSSHGMNACEREDDKADAVVNAHSAMVTE